MSDIKRPPHDAWERLLGLFYWLDEIRKSVHEGCSDVRIKGVNYTLPFEIDWPKGVDRWPMPKPEWQRAEFPRDFDKSVRFSNNCQDWNYGRLRGWLGEDYIDSWIDGKGEGWIECQVRVEPEGSL